MQPVYKLLERIDVKETEARIAKYQKEHQDEIVAIQARQAQEAFQQDRSQFETPTANRGEEYEEGKSTAHEYAPGAPGFDATVPIPTPLPQNTYNEEDLDPETRRLREMKAIEAGGWRPEIARQRAVEEALGTLFV